jgi:CheY-like chemotaxis protein
MGWSTGFFEGAMNGRPVAAGSAAVEKSGKPQGRSKGFLLLVDGNSRDLFATGMILQRLDYDVFVSSSAEEALGIMADVVPTLVVSDMLLPRMSGIKLLQIIKQDPRTASVSVIIQTSVTDPKVEELCLAWGCVSVLKKPVSLERLYSAVQHATESTPRNYIRMRTFLRAKVAGLPESAETGIPEAVSALSENGLYIRTLTPRSVKSIHAIEFTINGSLIKARAEVLYTFSMQAGPFKEPGMGMKFVGLPEADRKLIRGFIKDQITKDIPVS